MEGVIVRRISREY